MVFIKKVVNADAGTADLVGGNDWDKLEDYHDDVDISPAVAKINTATQFRSGKFKLRDSGDTHNYIFNTSDIAADRTITYPLLTADDTPTFNAFAATLTNKTISGSSNTLTNIQDSSLSSNVVREDIANSFGDFDTDFKDNRLRIWNPADTFRYTIVAASIAADRTLNLPLITGTDTLASLGLAQTFSAPKTFDDYTDHKRIVAPSDPATDYGRVYVKQIDSNNDGLFIKIKKNNAFQEVQIA